MFLASGTARGGGGGRDKGELHGQSMECEREVCGGLILGEGGRLDFILRSMGSHCKVFLRSAF